LGDERKMQFCKVCENMYYIEMLEKPFRLVYYCRHCGNKEETTSINSVFRKDMKLTEDMYFGINEYTKLDPTLPRSNNVPCPNPKCICNTNDGDNPNNDDDDIHEDEDEDEDEVGVDKNKKQNQKVDSEVVYIRYNHESMKYLYLCCHCDTVWKL